MSSHLFSRISIAALMMMGLAAQQKQICFLLPKHLQSLDVLLPNEYIWKLKLIAQSAHFSAFVVNEGFVVCMWKLWRMAHQYQNWGCKYSSKIWKIISSRLFHDTASLVLALGWKRISRQSKQQAESYTFRSLGLPRIGKDKNITSSSTNICNDNGYYSIFTAVCRS